MANVTLAYPNQADECTLSGGTWTAGLPLNNLKDRRLGKVARSSSAATSDTQFDAALSRVRPIRVLSLVGHSISEVALIRIRASNTAGVFTSPLYDSGWIDVWPVVFPLGTTLWDDPRLWAGKYGAEDLTGYTWTFAHVLPLTAARYWRIEIDDTTNAAGYVQIGRLFLSGAWVPTYNMSYGANLGYESKTQVEEAPNGAEFFDRRRSARIARFSLDWLTENEGMANALEMQRVLGVDGEVLFMWDSADTVHALRRTFLGRLRTLSPVETPHYAINKSSFEIKELL